MSLPTSDVAFMTRLSEYRPVWRDSCFLRANNLPGRCAMKRDLLRGAVGTLALGTIIWLVWGNPEQSTRPRGETADIKLLSARHAKD
jgi:hypothetical protein